MVVNLLLKCLILYYFKAHIGLLFIIIVLTDCLCFHQVFLTDYCKKLDITPAEAAQVVVLLRPYFTDPFKKMYYRINVYRQDSTTVIPELATNVK